MLDLTLCFFVQDVYCVCINSSRKIAGGRNNHRREIKCYYFVLCLSEKPVFTCLLSDSSSDSKRKKEKKKKRKKEKEKKKRKKKKGTQQMSNLSLINEGPFSFTNFAQRKAIGF